MELLSMWFKDYGIVTIQMDVAGKCQAIANHLKLVGDKAQLVTEGINI